MQVATFFAQNSCATRLACVAPSTTPCITSCLYEYKLTIEAVNEFKQKIINYRVS
jgi:hypothetical protein